ncbi:phage Gp37/Gp68 family protein [Sphingomonas sp.]|uniref:phage Gp37/Gp68 family protein n=1 Tax=Sphingomonas sp. TaxID=28214 RepID=UPI00307D68B8
MADNTKIEWTNATVNAVNGCSVISPGCKHCYAMKQAHRFLVRQGLTHKTAGGMVWTGEVRFSESALLQPLRWKRPRKIFWNAHGDLFHENVPDEWIDRVFAVCALTPQHQHQILTKRSARMRAYCSDPRTPERIARVILDLGADWGVSGAQALAPLGNRATEADPSFVIWPLSNVWLGVSVEDQQRADDRIPDLLATPAAVRFLSCEPLLGPVDLASPYTLGLWNEKANERGILGDARMDPSTGLWDVSGEDLLPGLDWVIVGGESGPGARPMHPDWARWLRDQCAAAGVPFFFKQWGDWESSLDRDRDDPDWRADYTNDYVDHGKSKWLNLAGGCGFHGERFHVMRWVGKRVAGRLLDGIQHNGMPA